MSIRVEECDVTVDFYGDHDRHRLEAERKLLRGGDDGGGDSLSTPFTSTPNSTPNPSTSSASNARKRREPDSDNSAEAAAAVANKRPRRILNSDGELHWKLSCRRT